MQLLFKCAIVFSREKVSNMEAIIVIFSCMPSNALTFVRLKVDWPAKIILNSKFKNSFYSRYSIYTVPEILNPNNHPT